MKQTDADMSSGVGAGYVPVKPGMSRSEEVDDVSTQNIQSSLEPL
jgi:hypothetical protein